MDNFLSELTIENLAGINTYKCPILQSVIKSFTPSLHENELLIEKSINFQTNSIHKKIIQIYYVTNIGRIFYADCEIHNCSNKIPNNSEYSHCNRDNKKTMMRCIYIGIEPSNTFCHLIKIILPFLDSIDAIINIFKFYKNKKKKLNDDTFLYASQIKYCHDNKYHNYDDDDDIMASKYDTDTQKYKQILNDNEYVISTSFEKIFKNASGNNTLCGRKFSVTNFGNIYYSESSAVSQNSIENNVKIHQNNINLNDACIELLQIIIPHCNSIDSINKVINMCKDYSKLWYIDNRCEKSNEVLSLEKLYLQEYNENENIKQKLSKYMEKYNNIKNELDNFKNKYDEISQENTKQKKELDEYKKILMNTIPIENQCCICFGFTDKKQFLLPCGHSQFCKLCITKIKLCSLCNSTIEKIKNIL